jgi:DOPA 4,5-dioxygenase
MTTKPVGPLVGYHAHIYFTDTTLAAADQLREAAEREWGARGVFVSRLVRRLVGPHPTPMFEIDFEVAQRDAIVAWLKAHRGVLTVLVHEVTGDDYRDHTDGVFWLGEPLPLDLSRMDPSKPTRVLKR